jgi:hypothetical protein
VSFGACGFDSRPKHQPINSLNPNFTESLDLFGAFFFFSKVFFETFGLTVAASYFANLEINSYEQIKIFAVAHFGLRV